MNFCDLSNALKYPCQKKKQNLQSGNRGLERTLKGLLEIRKFCGKFDLHSVK